jgi:acyl-CoA thioesterase
MFENDTASKAFGFELINTTCGSATVSMMVKDFMLNGHQTCHGGHIFTLADSAFAFACNSQNLAAVASSCTIDFVKPAHIGDKLIATAVQAYQGKRSGIYHVKVVNQDNQTIAFFKGSSARIKRNVLPHS